MLRTARNVVSAGRCLLLLLSPSCDTQETEQCERMSLTPPCVLSLTRSACAEARPVAGLGHLKEPAVQPRGQVRTPAKVFGLADLRVISSLTSPYLCNLVPVTPGQQGHSESNSLDCYKRSRMWNVFVPCFPQPLAQS